MIKIIQLLLSVRQGVSELKGGGVCRKIKVFDLYEDEDEDVRNLKVRYGELV
jgi:hypothetical protein